MPDVAHPDRQPTQPPLGLPAWPPRSVPAEIEARWRADGMWTDDSLGMLLDHGLRARPDLACRVYSDARPSSSTFADLRADALAVAGALQARGIGAGDPVAFHLPNWREAIVSFYAAAFLGAVVVPIVHFYGPKEVGYILQRQG